jgi:hypothetical protein
MIKTMLMATAAAAIILSAAPASAQIRFGVGPYGGGVEFGDGWREHGWRDHWRGAYAYDCPVVRERFVTPSGRVVIRTRRDCD